MNVGRGWGRVSLAEPTLPLSAIIELVSQRHTFGRRYLRLNRHPHLQGPDNSRAVGKGPSHWGDVLILFFRFLLPFCCEVEFAFSSSPFRHFFPLVLMLEFISGEFL